MSTISKASKREINQHQRIRNYYKFQSRIYDATRWAFLFGRTTAISQIPFSKNEEFSLAEIGCGTGYNLTRVARRFPNAKLYGVDVSQEMLSIAREKLIPFSNSKTFFPQAYGKASSAINFSPDVILFSYALTMINPQWLDLIEQAHKDLKTGGQIIVTDFYDSNFGFFKNHMSNHHVRMDAHLLPELNNRFTTKKEFIKSAYGGIWKYFVYVGEKR